MKTLLKHKKMTKKSLDSKEKVEAGEKTNEYEESKKNEMAEMFS